jgi:hypothetical protein
MPKAVEMHYENLSTDGPGDKPFHRFVFGFNCDGKRGTQTLPLPPLPEVENSTCGNGGVSCVLVLFLV